jgi:hypothetical protein
MLAESRSKLLWLFTEHRNATFIINFLLPQQAAADQLNVRFESWSSREVANLGLDAMAADLSRKANRTRPDAAIFSRFVMPHGQALIALCRSLGIMTIFHLDDLLQQIPADIGQEYVATYSETYMAELHACILASDGILASTPILAAHLADRYPWHNIRTVLGVCYSPAPGWTAAGMRSRLARFKRALTSVGVQTLGYMGSSSHLRDLATATPQIAELMRARPNLRFETLGLPAPDTLKSEFGNRVRQFGYSRNYTEFLTTLYELNWDLGLAPLVQDEFNRAKTATKFIEYTACGIPTLAEDVEPYSSVGSERDAIALASGGAWAGVAAELLSNAANRHQQLRRAQALCQSSFAGATALRQMLAAMDQLSTPRHQVNRESHEFAHCDGRIVQEIVLEGERK